jgi:guanine deaminase
MWMNDIVLKGTICYSAEDKALQVFENSYVVCVGGLCRGVFSEIPEEFARLPVLDYGQSLIVPGLVDLHIHAPQYTFRGTGMDLELMEWLQQQAFPEEARFADRAYAERAYGIFAQQLMRSATTRAVVFATRHGESTDILMEKMEETGLVSFVGKVNMDQNAPAPLVEESAASSQADTLAWLERTADRFERTKPILTPRFIPSCTRPLLESLGRIKGERKLPLQSHLSENLDEIGFVQGQFPEEPSYGHCYERYGLLEGSIMAHCVYSSEAEVQLLKQRGVLIAHCPASNTNIASGIAPIRKYLEGGLRVGLGSDVAGGHSESIFRAITDAVQVSKLYWRLVDQNCKPLSFPEAFFLATRGGGAFFGKVGAFEPGYEFDALVLREDEIPHWSDFDPRQRLERYAYLEGGGRDLKAKFVAGRQIF